MKSSHQLFEAGNLNSDKKEMVINPLYLETVSSIYKAINDCEETVLNFQPAHQEFTLQGIDIFRFAGRKIVEHWGTVILLPLLQQMENEYHKLALNGYSEISCYAVCRRSNDSTTFCPPV